MDRIVSHTAALFSETHVCQRWSPLYLSRITLCGYFTHLHDLGHLFDAVASHAEQDTTMWTRARAKWIHERTASSGITACTISTSNLFLLMLCADTKERLEASCNPSLHIYQSNNAPMPHFFSLSSTLSLTSRMISTSSVPSASPSALLSHSS